MNIATRTPLEPLIAACNAAIAKLEEEFDTEFLGTTDIRFKDIAPLMPEPPISKKAMPTTPQDPSAPIFGPSAFDTPQDPEAPSPLPSYASTARPAALRGTGGMDPVAQQIVAGLTPQFQELKQAIAGPKGWEALGQSIASILDRVIQPVAQSTPSQPLPALVAPDPRVEVMEGRISSLESTVTQLVQQQGQILEQQSSILAQLAQSGSTVADLARQQGQILELLRKQAPAASATPVVPPIKNEGPEEGDGEGGTPPMAPETTPTPAPMGPPPIPLMTDMSMPPIKAALPFKAKLPVELIITADLETLQGISGAQTPFMAEWYGIKGMVEIGARFELPQFVSPEAMLKAFWLSLINEVPGCTVYFHNWAGYDSILSLAALFTHHDSGFSFTPVVRNGQIISLEVFKVAEGKRTRLLTIKDSFKLLPSGLGKLAKDFKLEQEKGVFPHYFLLDSLESTMAYVDSLPAYQFFEPNRTSRADWEKMASQYGNNWNFMEAARSYLHSDCVALHQVLVTFFRELNAQFKLNPILNNSIPGISFKAWKQHQLPLLRRENLQVCDLSKSLDNHFRGAYFGGIVDVYRPHLKGQGYYYDVNSLYPTAMCRPMPVGTPTLVALNREPFERGQFFGYLWARVEAPADLYIGLLPIRYQDRLICPGGSFGGFFFSEELRFALDNGYRLLGIEQAWAFQRGENTFRDLIGTLNGMKVRAQEEGKPVLRNIAKLMMNSMYRRFGMHLEEGITVFTTLEGLNSLITVNRVLDSKKIGDLYLVNYVPQAPLGEQMVGTREVRICRPMETNVPIAAAVTAYSRMIINGYKLDALKAGLQVYYSDTDSLVLNGEPWRVTLSPEPQGVYNTNNRPGVPPGLVDPAKLGLLKLEHTFSEGFFVAPKIYWMNTPDGEVTKCKGYPGNLTREEIESLYRGEGLDLVVTRWIRSLTAQTVETQQPRRA